MFVIPATILPFLYVPVILVITWLVARLVSLVLASVMRASNPQVVLGARRLGALVVWLVGGIVAIQELGISPFIVLLFIALFGLAAILGLRPVLENFGARYFADVYSPFKVGDTIRVGVETGKVIEINAMTTVLLTEADTLVSLPNALFMREVVTNLSPQAWKELTIPLSVPSVVDLPAFESELLKSLTKLRLRLDKRFPPVLAMRARGPQSTDLTLTVMIRRPEERDAILAEVHARISDTLGRFTGRSAKRASAGESAPAP